MKTKSRMLAIVMALLMIATMLPVSAFAENDPPATNTDIVVEELTNSTEEPTKETASPAAPGELPGTGEDKEQGENSDGEEKTAGSTPTPEPTPIPSPEPSKTPAKQAAPAQGADDETPPAAIFTVTFDANGHGTAPEAVTVTEGILLQKPTDPAEDGYTFTGWYRDKETTDQWNFDTDTVTDNIILYAGWMEIPSAPAPVDDTLQDKEEEETVTKPMLRSAPPALNAPLQNGGLRAGQSVYLDLKYEGSGAVLASEYIGTEGTTVEIKALPSDGYRFKNWVIVSGTGSIGDVNSANTTFTMGTTDATVKAVFESLPAGGNSLVCYVFSGGTASATADPKDSAVYTLQATPASGYKFDFWVIIQGNGRIDNSNAASTTIRNCSGSVVVEAHFSTITYPITTNANPSEGGSTEGLPYWGGPAQQVNLTATPNDGYVFKEWKITSGKGRITNPTEAFTVLTDITEAVTCQAEFELIPSGEYRVSVTKNLAERGEAKANVPYGSTGTEVTLTATPASGYRFTRWEVTPANVVLADSNSATTTFQIGSEDVTVYAVFSYDAIYKTTGQTDGCGKANVGNNTLLSGERQQLTATPESGWSFDHWEVVSGGVTIDNEYARQASFVMHDQDVVVKAVFVPEQTNLLTEIKVTNPPKKDTYTAGESFDPDGMVVTAYYQEGSADVSGYTCEPSGMLAETDKNITISYTVNGVTKKTTQAITVAPATVYAIVYHLDGGTNDASNPATYTKFDTITLADPKKDGHTFGGWYDNASFSGSHITNIPAGSTGDKQFFAKWTLDTYNISYQNLKGASNSNPTTYTYNDTSITLQPPTDPTGYTFEGWYDNASFSGNAITEIPANSTGDKTFYAKWTADTYNISYQNVNGASNSNPATYTIADTPLTLAPLTGGPTGHTFDGWYDNASFSGSPITAIPAGITGDRTFYAKWTAVKYDVSVSASPSNGGTVTGGGTYADGDDVTVKASANTGYTFKHWTENGSVVSSNATYEFKATAARTLIAVFESAGTPTPQPTTKHTVTYIVVNGTWADGSTTPKTEEVEDGQSPSQIPTGMLPAENYEGGAWNPNPIGATITGAASFTYTFTAKQNPPQPTISYTAKDGSGNTIQSVTWQKGSGKNLDLTFKRSEDDHLTYGLFGSLEIGGVTVGSANYGASEGSLKLSIKPEYLETLSVGDHTVKVNFQDGSATVKLTVKAAASNPDTGAKDITSPKTGDESNLALWSSLMFLSVAAMFVLLLYARKRKIEK